MPETSIEIKDGTNQILPNATQSTQIFIGDSAIQQIQQQAQRNAPYVQVLNMFNLGGTSPGTVEHEMWRDNHRNLCEEKFKDHTVVCLAGEDGIGMTTFLSQFARKHSDNCVSYFYNGFDRLQLDTEVMERDITEQLYWFANSCNCPSDVKQVNDVYTKVIKQLKQTKEGVMYFVFDGFDDIPSEHKENICKLIEKLQWEKARFLLSGKKEQIEGLFKQTKKWSVTEVTLLRFSEAETNAYFSSVMPDLSKEHLQVLYKISRGNASRMNELRTKYLCNGRLEELMQADIDGDSDLNQEDFEKICDDDNPSVILLFALLAYAEFEFKVDYVAQVLEVSTDDVRALAEQYADYIQIKEDDTICLLSVAFRKYLCERLQVYKSDVEMRQIRILEGARVGDIYTMALPSLYKSQGQYDSLIKYLNADNVQTFLAEGHSQAALNVQCRFGFEACAAMPDKHLASRFRYSLNKAASREIERNELWDHEISALIAIGQHAKALALAHTVYLSEERLKCYLLIARKPDGLSPDDQAVLKDHIRQLVDEIDFEDIPEKSMELAKLLFPIDYKAAIDIVDRIQKAHQEDINTDKVFSQFSLVEQTDMEEADACRDLARSHIQNTDLRGFVDATANLFKKDDVDTLLEELKRLHSYAKQLRLLRYWLPAHKDKEDIGRVVLEALRLIVADSDTEMPKARELNDIARLMGTMTKEQMEEGLRYINSLGDTIMCPTSDYVDAMITVIEGCRNVLPEKSQELLESLYVFVDDLKDEGMWLACTAKLLGHFDRLGEARMVCKTIGTKEQLRSELKEKAKVLFLATAYHMKIVEGPIAALVCTEPELIETLISQMNTADRRSRAYSYAAEQYLVHAEPEKFDLDYFFCLLEKADIKRGDCGKPMFMLVNKLLSGEKLQHEALLPLIKKHIGFVEKLENVFLQCTVYMRIYQWGVRHFAEDPFVEEVKGKMLAWWETINQRHEKIEFGFHIAKILARCSKDEAEGMVARCSDLRRQSLLSSSSCVDAFFKCHNLYASSLIALISRGLCDEQILQAFSDDVSDFVSESERACMWGKIALAYHLAGNEEMFKSVGDQYLPTDYSQFTMDEQKWLIAHIAPALYLRGQLKFFNLLNKYDDVFRDICLRRVCIFIVSKKLDVVELNVRENYELTYSDCGDLDTLLDHMSNENVIFQFVEIIARSLRSANRKVEPLSTQQKKLVRETTSSIVEKKYPAPGGIQHDGYKIACQAVLEYADHAFNTSQKQVWENRFKTVDNKADRAFLYFYTAPFFAKHTDKVEFLCKGIDSTKDVQFNFDRLSRFDMALTECAINNLGSLMPAIAEEAFLCLRTDGTEEQYEGLLDTIHQYKPELAETIMEKLDKDPARVYNKRKLMSHLDSVKRLDKAGKDIRSVSDLDREEQRRFFDKRLNDLIEGKGQVQPVEEAFALTMDYLYNNTLSDAMSAIYYLLETISQRMKMSQNRKYADLLLAMHRAIRYNLRMVLSLASDTKERMEKVNGMFADSPASPEGYIGIGEYQKAIDFLLRWYQACGFNELTIIDPHFRPSDLSVIKLLTDENNNLTIRILAHKGDFSEDDYQSEWRQVSTGVKMPIQVTLVKYEGKSYGGPIRDRYWICVDDENDQRVGISLNCLSGLGQRESCIHAIEDNTALYALHSFLRYGDKKVKRADGMNLEYTFFSLS